MDDNSKILMQQQENESPIEPEQQVQSSSQVKLDGIIQTDSKSLHTSQERKEELKQGDFVDPFKDESEIRFDENDISAISIHSENEQPVHSLLSKEEVQQQKFDGNKITAHVVKPQVIGKAFPKAKIEVVKVLNPPSLKTNVVSLLSGLKIQKPSQLDAPPMQASESPEIKAKVIGSNKPPIIPLLQLGKVQSLDVNQIEKPLSSHQELALTQSQPTPNDEAPLTPHTSVPSNRQWQKVSITKKRSTTQAPKPKPVQKPSLHNSVIASQQREVINNQQPLPLTYREQLMSSPCVGGGTNTSQGDSCQFNRTEKLPNKMRRKAVPGEIIPLFDCLYCCQEHFVLERISQKTLMHKYAWNAQSIGLFFMEKLVTGSALQIDILERDESKEHNSQQDTAKVMRNALKFYAQQQYTPPLLRKTLIQVKQIQQSQPQRYNEPPPQAPEPIIDLNDPSFELDGSRMNMKTRRQRVLESISFETDCHNIYEPYFTSEDEHAQSDHSAINSEQVNHLIAQGFTTKRRQAIQRECSSDELNSSDALNSESSISQYLSKASHESVNLDEIRLEIPEDRIIRACELDGQSLSSIEVESFEEDEDEDRPRSALLEDRVRQMPIEIASSSPLKESKYSPPDNDQRQTFGCLTPMGMTLGKPQQINGPFHFIDEVSQMPIRISTHKFNQEQLAGLAQFAEDFKGEYTQDSLPDSVEAICEGDQSPIGKNLIVPTDLSPVLPEYTIMQRKRTQLVPRRLDNRSEEREGLYPQLVAQQNLFLQNGEITHRDIITSEDNSSISQIPKSQKHFIGEKESCFSPIQIEINDQSLSREGVIAAAQAREAIQHLQGPCFSSVDYDDVTMVQYNLPASSDQQQQSVNGLFGPREIAMTSNFAQNNEPQYIVEDLTASDIAVRNMIGNSSIEQNAHDGNIGSNTINLSNHYNQSFSAFHTKHVMNAHQTPLILQNGRCHRESEGRNYEEEPPIAESACKHKKKKFYIKQEQLTQLLHKAMEKKVTKKNANLAGNFFGDNTISSSEALMFIRQEGPSLFDSLIQQNYVKFEDDSGRSRELGQQQGIKTSQKKKSAHQVLPKHQKSIKTQDFGGAFKREGSIEDLRNGMHFSEDRAARIQGNTKSLKQLQFTGSVTSINNPKKLRIMKQQAEPQSRQIATQPIKDQKGNNQHSSFNNILLKNRINGQANDSERMIPTEVEEGPQTMRERQGYPELCADLQANGKYSVKVTDTRKIAVTPQFLINAFRNHIPSESQHALTKEQLNELLRSAICSSRYSTSSNGMNVAAALPSLNQAPSNYHNSTQQLEHTGKMRQLSIDQHKGSLHKANNSSGKKRANEYESKVAGKPSLSPNRGVRKNMPLLTEGCELSTQRYNHEYLPLHYHHHQRSIDQSSIQNHSNNKLGERKDSFTRKWQPPSAQNQMKFAKQLIAAQQNNCSVEKQRRKGLVNYASLDKQRCKTKKKTDYGSKDRLKQKKKPFDGPKAAAPQKILNQLLQNQTNLSGIGSGFNTNNASNFVTKNIFANQSNALNNHTTIQDNSNNLILNTLLATSGQQCEMSTTISNNQLSLTRIQSITNNTRGQSTGALNTQFLTKFVNQTVSSGSNQPSVINSTSLIGTKTKVHVPQLQLSKIKPTPQLNSRRGKQLNGSQDEIQLQSLLQNLNQHLQTNQTRASIHQDTSSSILRTPINVVMPQSNRVMGLQGNTKRSQISSMSAQRQTAQLGKGRRKDSIEQPPPEFIQVRTTQLNKTMNRPSIKKAGVDYKTSMPPSTNTAQQKDRKYKSKDPLQFVGGQRESIGKNGLQNSFTMKNLKQMIGALALPVGAALQSQLTTRLQESEPVEMRELVKNTTDSCERLIEGLQQEPTKMRLQGQSKKVLLNITQSSGGNGMAEVNRSSLISQKGQQSAKAAHLSKTATQNIIRRQQQVPPVKLTRFTNAPARDNPQGNGLLKNIPSASDLNRLFDTQKDSQASPSNRHLKFSKAPMPERYTLQPTIPQGKQHTMTLKSIFTKQQPTNASSHQTNQSGGGVSHQVFNTFQA